MSGNIPNAAMLSTLHQTPEEYNNNSQGVNFVGTYLSPNIPLWASAIGNLNIGPDIQLSTATFNVGLGGAQGLIRFPFAGSNGSQIQSVSTNAALLLMNRTDDVASGLGSLFSMYNNHISTSGVTNIDYEENVSIRYQIPDSTYDNLAIAKLYLYGSRGVIQTPAGVIGQNSSGGVDIKTSLFTVNGLPVGASPNPRVSSLTVNYSSPSVPNRLGKIILENAPLYYDAAPYDANASIEIQNYNVANQPDPFTIGTRSMRAANGSVSTNSLYLSGSYFLGGATAVDSIIIAAPFGASTITGGEAAYIFPESSGSDVFGIRVITPQVWISSMIVSTINGVAPGSYVPPENFTASSIGLQTLTVQQTAGISSLSVSSINGSVYPAPAFVNPDLSLSTLRMNRNGGLLWLQASTINATPSISSIQGAQLLFDFGVNAGVPISVKALPNIGNQLQATGIANGLAICDYNLGTTANTDFIPIITGGVTFGQFLADYNSPVGRKYGTIAPVFSTLVSPPGVFSGLLISTPNLTINAPATYIPVLTVSTLNAPNTTFPTVTISTVNASVVSASTIKFTASAGGVDLGGIDLGMGGFLGGLTGQLVSGSYNTIIGGVALGTGVTALVNSRNNLAAKPPPGGNISSFTTINGTTQLQFSTLGTNVSTYYRYTSSIGGSDPSLRPALEVFTSSIIAPGTLCLRSFSDPINPANPSTFTSTLQSFGQWVPVPAADSTVPSVIVASTINVSTMIVRGQAPSGVVLAVPQGNVQVGGATQGVTLTNGGLIQGNSVAIIGPGTRPISCGILTAVSITSPGTNSIGGVTIGTPSGQLTATNINTGTLVATNATVSDTVATTNISTLQSINGAPVKYSVLRTRNLPAFNSAPYEVVSPFNVGDTTVNLSLPFQFPCCVTLVVSPTQASTQYTSPPMGAAYNVVIFWCRDGLGNSFLAARLSTIYAQGITASIPVFYSNPALPISVNIQNTSGVNISGVQFSYFVSSWSD